MSIENQVKLEKLEHDVKNLQQAVAFQTEAIKQLEQQLKEDQHLRQELHDLKHKIMAKTAPKKAATDGKAKREPAGAA